LCWILLLYATAISLYELAGVGAILVFCAAILFAVAIAARSLYELAGAPAEASTIPLAVAVLSMATYVKAMAAQCYRIK
jgi:hypothetical protein